jgi:hypothetical protein
VSSLSSIRRGTNSVLLPKVVDEIKILKSGMSSGDGGDGGDGCRG